MIYDDNIARNKLNKEFMHMLTNAAKTFSEHAGNFQTYAERIRKSCGMTRTIGATHKNLLIHKANNIKRLADLNQSAARYCLRAAHKHANGTPKDEILEEMRNYNIFFADQLKSEQNEIEHTLSSLVKALS